MSSVDQVQKHRNLLAALCQHPLEDADHVIVHLLVIQHEPTSVLCMSECQGGVDMLLIGNLVSLHQFNAIMENCQAAVFAFSAQDAF